MPPLFGNLEDDDLIPPFRGALKAVTTVREDDGPGEANAIIDNKILRTFRGVGNIFITVKTPIRQPIIIQHRMPARVSS